MKAKGELRHPAFGLGVAVSVRVDESGQTIAYCRFDNPPGMASGSQGLKPMADVIMREAEEHDNR